MNQIKEKVQHIETDTVAIYRSLTSSVFDWTIRFDLNDFILTDYWLGTHSNM